MPSGADEAPRQTGPPTNWLCYLYPNHRKEHTAAAVEKEGSRSRPRGDETRAESIDKNWPEGTEQEKVRVTKARETSRSIPYFVDDYLDIFWGALGNRELDFVCQGVALEAMT